MSGKTLARRKLRCFQILGLMLPLARIARADVLSEEHDKLKVQPVIPLQAHAFELRDVRLLPGPFEHALELDKQYLLSLDVERLLRNFRINAGLPTPAQPLGGWEAPDGELRGHFVGHFLSACALMYASTGDARLKDKADAVVAGLAECQAKLGNGYLSAFPETFFDRVEKRTPVWAPYYTLHKIFAGLEDAYLYCDNRQALNVAQKFGDWVIERNGKLSDDQMQAMLGTEHGGMNETLANLYALTGEKKYLGISLRFNHRSVIGPAERREDPLTGLHANTQIPKFIGTARQYEFSNDPALKTASVFFWDTVTRERSYVIGGHSDGEMFTPKEHLSQALGRNTTETCNTYNMLKLTRDLICWQPQAEYADFYERALFNHILASQNPETGMMCYYVPLRSGAHREFNTPNDSFWCCTGTGVENHSKYGDSIYFHDQSNLWVNLFIASELDWKSKGIHVRQETAFPDQSATELKFTCDQPSRFTVQLRHPYWASNGFEVRVDGKLLPQSQSGSYVHIERTWKTGDRILVNMPFQLRTEAFQDNPDRFAVMDGPLVLCAAVDARKPLPAVVGELPALLASLKPVPGKTNTFAGSTEFFRTSGESTGQPVILAPFYQAYNEHYVTYWDRFTPEKWAARQRDYERDLGAQRQLEARTIDMVRSGEEQNERDHHFQGELTDTREFNDRLWRITNTNGWFSWELKIEPNAPQELLVEFGGSRSGSALSLSINDTQLQGNPAASAAANSGPRTTIFALPPDLLKDKDKITVKFQAPANARGISVAGARVVRSERVK